VPDKKVFPWIMSAGTEPSRNAKAKGDTTSTVKPTITAADLAIHNRPDDLWIAIDGKVFDITKWANSHPGNGPHWRLLDLARQN
jgi:cytochrome b involved in lipid metabolism